MTTLRGLAAELRHAGDDLSAELVLVAAKAGQNIKTGATEAAPDSVRRSPISYEVEVDGNSVTVSVESESPFGAIQEYGTPSNPGGSPFMTPAFEDEVPKFEKYALAALAKVLR